MLTRFLAFVFIVFLLLFSQACNESGINDSEKRNENWCWFVDKNTGEGRWVPIGDQTTLPDGDYTLFFCNGGIRQTGKLKDQKDCDTIFYYDLAGKIISKVITLPDSTAKEFMPDGKYTSYYPTCEISGKGEVKNNKIIGTRYLFYKNGKQKFRSFFINDSTQIIANFFETGQIKDSMQVVNEKNDGFCYSWHANGKPAAMGYFKNGVKDGPLEWYYDNGKIEQKGKMKNGMPDDTIKDWYPNGQMKLIRFYRHGVKEGKSCVWFENGQVQIEVSFINDNKHDQYNEYNDKGILIKSGRYNNGAKTGLWKQFDDNGKLIDSKQY